MCILAKPPHSLWNGLSALLYGSANWGSESLSDVTKVTQLVSGGAGLFYFKTFALSKEVFSVDLGQRGVRLQLCTLEEDIMCGSIVS